MIEVELPDGSVAEFPDGTSPDVMKQALAKYRQPAQDWKPKKRTAADIIAEAKAKQTGETSWTDAAVSAFGKSFRDTGLGLAQSISKGGPNAAIAEWLVDKAGLKPRSLSGLVSGQEESMTANPVSRWADERIAANSEADAQLMNQPGSGWGYGGGVVTQLAVPGAGSAATAKSAPALSSALRMLSTPKTLPQAAIQGAVLGDIRPTQDGESRAYNTAVSAATSVAGQKVGDILGASAAAAKDRVAPEIRRLYEAAKARGINLTPAQLSDSQFVKRLSGMLDALPLSGARGRMAKQNAAGNKALASLVGQNADTLDSTVVGRAADELGSKFDKVFSSGGRFDAQFLREVVALKNEAAAQLDETAQRTLQGWINRIKLQGKGGQLPPRVLQGLDQSARKAATGGGDRQQIATAFREALHENFGRNAPAGMKAEWDTIRKQYATLKTLEPLVARNPEGGVPMTQLMGAVNATKRGRTAMARGKAGEIGELAKIGQRMKKPNSSGTGENVQASAAGAGLLTNPLLTLASLSGGAGLARLFNSNALARAQMRQPGAIRAGLAPAAQPLGLLSSLFFTEDERGR